MVNFTDIILNSFLYLSSNIAYGESSVNVARWVVAGLIVLVVVICSIATLFCTPLFYYFLFCYGFGFGGGELVDAFTSKLERFQRSDRIFLDLAL
ncbi:MAG: hypothetical protein AMR96_06755 [Candidatus Adiutrix intracellularis]|nr:MAG: hypothetical protein AMR96_06755 [Candidatus Adiutrix intracellularis]MDR2827454.1 hypothetical protein [Candidatus Adiutrix intracellularis]